MNPIALRMLLTFVATASAFALGVFFIRRMRRSLTAEGTMLQEAPSAAALPMHTYHAVIQQLKQQKHELESEQQVERRRAKTSENISAAILSNLSSGVMFITPDGLVRQANASAKRILGFAAPVGMKVAQIFQNATAVSPTGEATPGVATAIEAALREKAPFLRLTAGYLSPLGTQRTLDITLTSVRGPSGDPLGAACLINDQSDMAQIRRQQEMRGEMAGEMALSLRNSLTTIAGYARHIAACNDLQSSHQLANDIAAEAEQLESTLGGFLAGERAMSASAGH